LSKRRVVVTGLGIVSPVGNDVASAWASILAGPQRHRPVTRFDTTNFPTHFGGEIRELDLEPYMSAKDARRMDAFMQYGVVAGMQAMRDSGLVVTEANSDRIGVLMGSGMGGLESIEKLTTSISRLTRRRRCRRSSFRPASSIWSADICRSPSTSPVRIWRWPPPAPPRPMRWAGDALIQYGEADAMLAGGSEMATCVTGMSGFAQAKALSQRNDDPQGPAVPGTRTATASSWATAPAP
jgi:3-oxoacyl-[acyl-carrier-protein] synthase II